MDNSCLIIQNYWKAHYKILLFNALHNIYSDFKVLYLAETEHIRKWKVEKNEIKFPFDVMFKGKIDDISFVKLAIETYRRLNLYNPEVIIIGGYDRLAYWAALIWAKKHRRKAIVIIESHYLDRPRYKLKESIKKLFVSQCDAALVAGTRHREYMISLGMKLENTFIMKGVGGVDLELYERDVAKFRMDRIKICNQLGVSSRNFLYVGRFSPEKNIMFLLEAYKRLKDERVKEWGLILVGDGPQKEEVESFISENKINDILLAGFKQPEEIPLYYAISDVFILPSISEPWGLVVNEAMAAGIPVLVSRRCGCYPDLIKEGVNGFSFDPFNREELYGLMKNVVEGKYNLEAMGEASIDIIKEYSPERAAKVIAETIEFVLRSGA